MSRRVIEAMAGVTLLLTVVLLVLIVTWKPVSSQLGAFEGSTGFLMTSEPASTLSASPYMDIEQRRAAGGPDGEVAISTDPTYGQIGTYNGTLIDTCDVSVLTTHLTDRDVAAGQRWATAAGIAPNELASFLGSMSAAALLDAETWTLHGDGSGERVSETKLIEVGTAVLVDADGVARVRCLDGNPLTASIDVAESIGTPVAAVDAGSADLSTESATPGSGELPLDEFDFTSCRLVSGADVLDAGRQSVRISEGETVEIDEFTSDFDLRAMQAIVQREPFEIVNVADVEGRCDGPQFVFVTTSELVVYGQPSEAGSSEPVRGDVEATTTGRHVNGFAEVSILIDDIEQIGWVDLDDLL